MPCICKHQLAALSGAARLDLGFHVTPPTALLRLAANLSMAPPAIDIPLLDELRNMRIPALAMGPAHMGTLSSLVNAALSIRTTLGIDPLAPNAALQLRETLGTLHSNMSSLRLPTANLGLTSHLSAAATAVAQIRANLNTDPLMPNAQLALNEAIGQMARTPTIPSWAMPHLSFVMALSPLLSIGSMLGLNLGTPTGLHALSAHIRALAGLNLGLPSLNMPQLTSNLQLLANLANINAHLGLNLAAAGAARQAQSMMSALANLRISPPAMPALALPPIPNIRAALGLGNPALSQLAGLHWSVPSFNALSLLNSILPQVSLVAQLQAVGPMLGVPRLVLPSACGSGCPLGG